MAGTQDYVTATLRDNSLGHTTTILAKTCSNTGAYVEVVVSLSGYANHKATLTLISHDDGHATSYAFFDDAATS
jgi:serine protease